MKWESVSAQHKSSWKTSLNLWKTLFKFTYKYFGKIYNCSVSIICGQVWRSGRDEPDLSDAGKTTKRSKDEDQSRGRYRQGDAFVFVLASSSWGINYWRLTVGPLDWNSFLDEVVTGCDEAATFSAVCPKK